MSPNRSNVRTAVRLCLAGMALVSTLALIYRSPITPTLTSPLERDDADAVVHTFGAPDSDYLVHHVSGDPLSETRVMVYRARDVRLMFARRRRAKALTFLWKFVGPTDMSGRRALAGDEAVRRLKRR